MTRRERIKNATDQELMDMLDKRPDLSNLYCRMKGPCPADPDEDEDTFDPSKCFGCFLAWLDGEAEPNLMQILAGKEEST